MHLKDITHISIVKYKKNEKALKKLNSLTEFEINQYCQSQGYKHVNALELLANYKKRNWKSGNAMITDWHSAVDEWEARESRKIKEKEDEEYKIYHRPYMDRCLNRS